MLDGGALEKILEEVFRQVKASCVFGARPFLSFDMNRFATEKVLSEIAWLDGTDKTAKATERRNGNFAPKLPLDHNSNGSPLSTPKENWDAVIAVPMKACSWMLAS